MRLRDMKTADEVLADHLQDPEFAAEWERTSVAREVAIALVAYRAEHNLTQAEVARLSGLTQPQIARLETGEREPRFDTLQRLTTALGIRLHIDIGSGSSPVVKVDVAPNHDKVEAAVRAAKRAAEQAQRRSAAGKFRRGNATQGRPSGSERTSAEKV